MQYAWATATDPGRVRDHNEDSMFPVGSGVAEERFTGAVADGMGGHVGGEVASRIAIATASESDHLEPEERVLAANLAVIDEVLDRPRLAGMGTTLTLVDVTGGLTRIAHVGDSRAYRLADGSITQITRDHSMVAEMVAAGDLTPEQAATHPYRSVITRAIGLERGVQVDTVELRLSPGDRLLVCSDGLSSMVADTDLQRIAGEAADLATAARDLIAAANAAGGEDNITVLLVEAME